MHENEVGYPEDLIDNANKTKPRYIVASSTFGNVIKKLKESNIGYKPSSQYIYDIVQPDIFNPPSSLKSHTIVIFERE